MFAAIHVPEFPVEAILRAEPELREQTVAVVEGTPPLVHVIAVNEKAAQAGIEPGMTRLQAEERLAANKGSVIRPRSAQREAAAHAALLDCACGFSPRVEDTAADTVLVDLAGLERIFGPPAKIARDVARRCSELGLEANVAVAANPDAAMHAARGFPGITVIPPGAEAERLGSLPVDVLLPACVARVSDPGTRVEDPRHTGMEMLDTLDRWGVRNLRALAALPEVAITERLGQEGLHWQKLARGATSRPLLLTEPPLAFEENMELEYPVGELEPLSFVLNRMLEQLCARLAARALAASEVKVRFELDLTADVETCGTGLRPVSENPPRRHRDTEENNCRLPNADCRLQNRAPRNRQLTIGNRQCSSMFDRTLRLPVPMLDAKVFLKLLQLDLQANPPSAPVAKVWLSATPAEPRRAQDGLFLPAAPAAERLEVTLAKIQRVVGSMVDGRQSTAGRQEDRQSAIDNRQCSSKERVGSPEILDTHRPDAFRMNKFAPPAVPSTADQSLPRAQPRGPSTQAITALRVFRPPLMVSIALRDGRPARLACPERPGLAGDITWCAGPWRSSGEWWSEQAWSREEWDVSLGDVLYRIYRDTIGWFVEGSYD